MRLLTFAITLTLAAFAAPVVASADEPCSAPELGCVLPPELGGPDPAAPVVTPPELGGPDPAPPVLPPELGGDDPATGNPAGPIPDPPPSTTVPPVLPPELGGDDPAVAAPAVVVASRVVRVFVPWLGEVRAGTLRYR